MCTVTQSGMSIVADVSLFPFSKAEYAREAAVVTSLSNSREHATGLKQSNDEVNSAASSSSVSSSSDTLSGNESLTSSESSES
jgi:hypothetical protein